MTSLQSVSLLNIHGQKKTRTPVIHGPVSIDQSEASFQKTQPIRMKISTERWHRHVVAKKGTNLG